MSSTKPIALVIGDVMLDRRSEGEMRSISSEAPVPVIRQTSLIESLGGAGNVARNIRTLGHEVLLMGVVGNDSEGQTVTALAATDGIMACLPTYTGPTVLKHRITCSGQIICRLDREQMIDDTATPALVNGLYSLPANMQQSNREVKVIVIADYGKGTMTPALLNVIREYATAYGIPIFVDTRPESSGMYKGVTLLKPNMREATEMLSHLVHPGLATGLPEETRRDVACSELKKEFGVSLVVVTHGRYGCAYTDPDDEGRVHVYDAVGLNGTDVVRDVCGAGDTVMAGLAVGLMEGKPFSMAVDFAMYCAGWVVQFHGVQPAMRDAVEDFIYKDGGWARKLMTLEQVVAFVERSRRQNEHTQIVFTNGCFDGFHAGHLETLRHASQQGDVLIVAYNDDASLAALKGPGRPHVPDSYRASHLALQDCVSAVVRFNGDVVTMLRHIRPDVLVKGADAKSAPVPGADYLAQHGGRVIFCPIDQFAITIDRSRPTAK